MALTQTTPPAQATPRIKHEFMKVEYRVSDGTSVMTYAKLWYRFNGATEGQWRCLKTLWTLESHWNYKARNKHGGAYGIPQAYPANKMAKFGKDWKHNPATQIMWGLDYINHRYNGNACIALKHEKRKGFY